MIFKLISRSIEEPIGGETMIMAVIELPDRVVIFEFKVDGSADKALEQAKRSHQKRFTSFIDLELAHDCLRKAKLGNYRSFQRLYHAIEQLLQAADKVGACTPLREPAEGRAKRR